MLTKLREAVSSAAPKKEFNTRVQRLERLSPHLLRVVLTGQALDDFPSGFEGGYVKLALQRSDGSPCKRSYTVRGFSPQARELVLDMVVHDHRGPAADWIAAAVQDGELMLSGPGRCAPINVEADAFLLAGDLSALPAICVNLARLPADAIGQAVLEVPGESDMIDVLAPAGVHIQWLFNPITNPQPDLLERTVRALPWPEGQVAVWIAGEFDAARGLRRYLRTERAVPKSHSYISCYWKRGVSDEGMKAAKRNDRDMW
ncbi:MAG: siderophore-interacting protein [Pseudomonadota bacterium]